MILALYQISRGDALIVLGIFWLSFAIFLFNFIFLIKSIVKIKNAETSDVRTYKIKIIVHSVISAIAFILIALLFWVL